MDFEKLWDSRKFHMRLDDLLTASKKKISEEEKKDRVKELLEAAGWGATGTLADRPLSEQPLPELPPEELQNIEPKTLDKKDITESEAFAKYGKVDPVFHAQGDKAQVVEILKQAKQSTGLKGCTVTIPLIEQQDIEPTLAEAGYGKGWTVMQQSADTPQGKGWRLIIKPGAS